MVVEAIIFEVILLLCEIAFTVAVIVVGVYCISSCMDSEKRIAKLEKQVKELLNGDENAL